MSSRFPAGYELDPEDPRAPSEEQWARMTADERARVVARLDEIESARRAGKLNAKLSEEEQKLAEERQKLAEERQELAEERQKLAEERRRRLEAERALAEALAEIERIRVSVR